MGQYHITVNLDKREFISPWQLGDGLKLWEFGASGDGGVMHALSILLTCSNGRGGGDYDLKDDPMVGRWAGDRIAIVGDYAEIGDLAPEHRADLIYSIAFRDDDTLDTALAAIEARRQTYGDSSTDDLIEHTKEVYRSKPYTNITPQLRTSLEALGYTYGKGDGWVTRDRSR